MDKANVFQFMLFCVCVSSTVAEIYGLDSETKVQKDYIVVLKHKINDTNKHALLQSVETYTKDISATDDNNFNTHLEILLR